VTVLAVVVAGLAAAVATGGRPNLVQARLRAPALVARRDRHEPRGVSLRVRTAVAVAGGLVAGLMIGGLEVAVPAGLAAGLVVMTRFRARMRRQVRGTETEVLQACLLLAAELRSGAHPHQAVVVAAAEWPDLLGTVARRSEAGAEVSAALREAAIRPGRSALSGVAAGWEVSERTGAALSDMLTAVADSLRAEATARREADAQLSSVRVTARLLAFLPVGTLVLFSGGDGGALRFLISNPYGLACLGAAAVLVAVGLWWIDRLVRAATSR
jgi:tight adherence protein B